MIIDPNNEKLSIANRIEGRVLAEDIISPITGEVLATANHDEPYITEEWSLMVLGWLMKTTWEIEG